MSESYTGKIARLEPRERGSGRVVMEQTVPESEYEGKRFAAFTYKKDSEEKTDIWKALEEYHAASSTVTIDFHVRHYQHNGEPRRSNDIDNVKMAEPQGDWSGGSPAAPEAAVHQSGLNKEEGEILKKALAATVDEFVGGA